MNTKHARAFTLVEVLAVVVLIGLLAVFVVPQILNRVGPARHSIAKTQIASLTQILAVFQQDVGRYPTQSEGLGALIQTPPGVKNWKGPYCKQDQITDPWGNEFIYKQPGAINKEYDILSYGADGQSGGEGVNADLGN